MKSFFSFFLICFSTVECFVIVSPGLSTRIVSPVKSTTATITITTTIDSSSTTRLNLFGGNSNSIPASSNARDQQAIDSVKAAIAKPRTPSFPLIECEFPPLQSQNKLGDGSLRSANEVDKANISFCTKLVKSISPLPVIGPKVWLLTSAASSNAFNAKVESALKGSSTTTVLSLRNGLPKDNTIGKNDICVLLSPNNRNDYKIAKELAQSKIKTVVVNGLAKDTESIPGKATMAYFLKPLTYNSQVVGYLIRNYPKNWAVIDIVSKETLKTYTDSEILYAETNTPDLRESGRLIQKSVDERAIKARGGK